MSTIISKNSKSSARVTYRTLSNELPPKVIQTEAEYERVLTRIEQLMLKSRRNKAESAYLDTWVQLVEYYESQLYKTPDVPPAQLLAHLIEVSGKTKAAIAAAARIHPGTISDIVNGKRSISKDAAAKLAEYFQVDISLFLIERPVAFRPVA